jgi:hypothetical protein
MSLDTCDPVCISTPRPSPPHSFLTPNRYRRSPIQVSALWRPVRQKVCSSISRRTTHLQSNFILGSDLLSRHINKCHPNEKPLVSSSTPSRRKGTSSASRATTSKQACDQCVQSTLPCDGANPCCQSRIFSPAYSLSRMPFYPAKCLHRKTRCTYVKFHRQTAPVGPGHPARSANDSSNPAHASLGALPLSLGSYRLPDPFLLPNNASALNPSAITQQTNSLYTDHQFSFPPPLQLPAPTYDNSLDYSARYRAQADFLTRTGAIPQERAPPLPAIYQESQAPHDPSNAARYAQSYHMHNDPQDYPLPPSPTGVDYGYNIDNKVCFIYFPSPLVD